jgi:hypothetical protein
MKNYNNIYYFWYNNVVFILLVLTIFQFIHSSDIYFCDSNENINDFIIEDNLTNINQINNDNVDNTNIISAPIKSNFFIRIKNHIKSKLYWHLSVKDTCKYNSYKDFKNSSWQSSNSIWDEFKSEIKSEWNLLKQGKLKKSPFDIKERIRIDNIFKIHEENKVRIKSEWLKYRYGNNK